LPTQNKSEEKLFLLRISGKCLRFYEKENMLFSAHPRFLQDKSFRKTEKFVFGFLV